MEENKKKPAAVKTAPKKAKEASIESPAKAVKTTKPKTPESTTSAKVAPKTATPKAKSAPEAVAKKPTAKKAKATDAPVEPAVVAKKPTAQKAKAAESPTEAAIVAKKPAAKKAKATEAPAEAAIVAKKPVAKKSKAADATALAPEAAAKKSTAPKAKSREAAVAKPETAIKKPSSKKAKTQESAVATPETATKKPASKKAKASETPASQPESSAKKPSSKKSKTADAPVAAPSTEAKNSSESEGKKVRLKPRRRELKRLGLLKPKENKKQQRADEAARAKLNPAQSPTAPKGKDAPEKGKSPATPTNQSPKSETQKAQTSKGEAQKSPAPKSSPFTEAKSRDHKSEDRSEGKSKDKTKGGGGKPSQFPNEFGAFKKQISPKTERKNERRQERADKVEREYDQSQGLFEEPIRLNRFVALSGICSRRDADTLIADGKVKVNGKVVREMGFKVQPGKDKIVYKDHELRIKVFVYLLMNKPKNKITTTDDELGRDTVMEIAERYTKARVYPVGRLDRNTTGLLLLTNDGDLTQKLTHPSSKFPKVYQARLDKEVAEEHLQALRKGFELEDGFIKADKVEYVDGVNLNEIGITIHSGANHIVKRMMDHLGYEVLALDRVQLGPLSKRGLPRGTCRLLSEKEIGFLKML